MKNKKNLILGIIFLLLLLIVLFPIFGGDKYISSLNKPKNEISLSQFTDKNIKSVSIKQLNKEITLTNNNGNWLVSGKPVSKTAIDALTSSFINSTVGHVVSKNASNQNEFGFSPENVTKLKITSSSGVAEFEIGNNGSEMNSLYMRAVGSKNIHLVTGDLKNSLKLNAVDWRDKTVIKVDPGQITKIQVTDPEFILSINKDNKWELAYKGNKSVLTDEKANPAISAVSDLTAYDFLTSDEDKQFSKAENLDSVTITDKTGKSQIIKYIKKDTDYWMSRDGATDKFKVYSYNISGLFDVVK